MVEFDDGLAVAMRGAVQARREDAVSLLQELVRVPSVTGEEGAVGAVVGRAFSERGLEVDTWEATREETEPYRDHVGEQSTYENRPNVAGTRRGQGKDAPSCWAPTPTPWTRETRLRGKGIHSRATWRAICSTDAAPAT